MKSRNIKTRLAAFGLALLMGISPLGNLADVHAAETKNPSEPVTESAEISETEQTEEVSEAAKHLVTAEDLPCQCSGCLFSFQSVSAIFSSHISFDVTKDNFIGILPSHVSLGAWYHSEKMHSVLFPHIH